MADEDWLMFITIENKRKVSPFYSLAMKLGLLGLDDLYAPATLVLHLENYSTQYKTVFPGSIELLAKKYNFLSSEITAGPIEKVQTEEVNISVPTYDIEVEIILVFTYESETYRERFIVKRQTVEEMQERIAAQQH